MMITEYIKSYLVEGFRTMSCPDHKMVLDLTHLYRRAATAQSQNITVVPRYSKRAKGASSTGFHFR